MIKDKASFLRQLADSDVLKENILAHILSENPDIDTSSRESFFDKLSPFYKSFSIDNRISNLNISQEENELNDWAGLDLRIKNIKLHSIRGLPMQTDNVLFGIDFTNTSSEPQSMIVLGGNSVGKSSIYDAIEYSFCQRIGEAQLRTSESHNDSSLYFKNYLQHFDNSFDQAECIINLQCGKVFEISKENIPLSVRKKINPNSHFISDYDIYTNGQLNFTGNNNQSFQNLIANSIGLSELLQKEKELFSFASYSRKIETSKKTNLEREITSSEEIIDKNKKLISEKNLLLKELNSGKTENEKFDNQVNRLKIFNQVKELSIEFEIDELEIDKIKTQFDVLFDQAVALSKDNRGLNHVEFLEEGLKLLHEEKSCPICNNSNLNTEEIKKHLESKIELFKNFNKLSSELNRASKAYSTSLSDLNYDLLNIRGKITYEISLIKDDEKFHELLTFNNQFISLLNELHAQDIFLKIPVIENDELTNSVRQNHLRELAFNSSSFFIEILPSYKLRIQELIKKRKLIIDFVQKALDLSSQPNSKEGEIAVIERDILQLQSQINMEEKNLLTKRPELLLAIENLELYNKIKKETRIYANEFHRQLGLEVKSAFDPIQKIVKEILDKYLYIEGRPATLKFEMKPESWDDETGEVISEIITAYIQPLDNSFSKQEVNKYFNTFHYRLFCTMVGISIAVASRKNTGINLPLVLDDIFYASDFENRTTIEEFVIKLFELFKEFTPDKELQLILLTHDQLIFDCIIKATISKNIPSILFAKLFKHEEAELENDFKNLVYRMPINNAYTIHELTNSVK